MNFGNLVEITGKKGSGKTQVSFSICAINSINNKKTLFIDGSGNFRPERIKSMIDKHLSNISSSADKGNAYLKSIAYQRIYELDDLIKLIKKIKLLNFELIILDDIIPLFTYKFKDNIRLEVRNFIRELSLIALSEKKMIVLTNLVIEKMDKEGQNGHLCEFFFHYILRYVHYKFYLKVKHNNNNITECKLVHPFNISSSKTYFDFSNL
ncbi:MAG: hypothetical protein M3Z01_00365 [Thermoproteota archaeon]|nr:hypothetical protein [Thermoproteota archaeon]